MFVAVAHALSRPVVNEYYLLHRPQQQQRPSVVYSDGFVDQDREEDVLTFSKDSVENPSLRNRVSKSSASWSFISYRSHIIYRDFGFHKIPKGGSIYVEVHYHDWGLKIKGYTENSMHLNSLRSLIMRFNCKQIFLIRNVYSLFETSIACWDEFLGRKCPNYIPHFSRWVRLQWFKRPLTLWQQWHISSPIEFFVPRKLKLLPRCDAKKRVEFGQCIWKFFTLAFVVI